MGRKILMALVLTLGMFVLWSGLAFADGIIIPDPPPGVPPERVPPLSIRYHRVKVTIEDQVATTHIDQVFVNDSPYELEGTFIFPLPLGAAIEDFAMYVEGERLEGRLLSRQEARRIYERIVSQRRDPALLEYVGRDAFQARVFPIPPHGEKRIELTYRQVLKAEDGLVRYIYPLDTERFSAKPLEEASIVVDLRSKAALKAIYSPSHEVEIEREGDHRAIISWEETKVKPDKDFLLYYSLAEGEFGLSLLSYRKEGSEGFFMLLAAPRAEVEAAEIVAKDVIFVLDTSGSMRGGKLEHAQRAAKYILENLNQDDRFNIVAFSSSTRAYAEKLRPAAEQQRAVEFVDSLRAGGSTDIGRALLEAVAMAEGDRPLILIFLTDGRPTLGMTEPTQIASQVGKAALESVRIFTFGVGDDVNAFLLDRLAQENRGTSAYVRPGEDIEERVSDFYAKVTTPLLADISLEVQEVSVSDTYPYPLPDLFLGGQLVLVGRYREGGEATITLKGEVNGEERSFVYEGVDFRQAGGEDFIPRLWAARKIGYLLAQIRAEGQDSELVKEVVELSLRYGIMTPYTSYLVEEDEDVFTRRGRDVMVTKVAEKLAGAPQAGAKAVERSLVQENLRQMEQVKSTHVKIAHVGEKTFLLKDGVWIDTAYDESRSPLPIGFGSPRYFEVLTEHPEWGRYLALGRRVIWVADGVTYEVREGEVPELTPLPTHELRPSATPAPTPSAPASDVEPAPMGFWARLWVALRALVASIRKGA